MRPAGTGKVQVRQAKHSRRQFYGPGRKNWAVWDAWGHRKYVYVDFETAIRAATQLQTDGTIPPKGLVGIEWLYHQEQRKRLQALESMALNSKVTF